MNRFIAGRHSLELGKKTYIMGILNVTPDSFSDGGKYFTLKEAIRQAEKMIDEGADIIDIGAVSTRPFSEYVSQEEEWERLKYILCEIRKNFTVPVSIDTFNPFTAERCLDLGADIINDVSGVFSAEMAELIKRYNCGWVVMHGGVSVRKTEEETVFSDGIINDVNSFFEDILREITLLGIPKEHICLDAGFGFSKNNEQNNELLENYEKINKFGRPLLCALSRKRFISELTGAADSEKRDEGTLAANIIACSKGADIIRVHNVALHKKAFLLFDSICRI